MSQPYHLVLGSQSPRRQKLMSEMGFTFAVRPKDTDESYPSNLKSHEVAEYISNKKSEAFIGDIGKDELIICADTVVIFGDEILGKPKTKREAIHTLELLSNTSHDVISGVSLRSNDKHISFSDLSQVHFSHMPKHHIEHYVNNYEPLDKAGSYGIQEWLGHNFIERIEGSYTNIMGLPTEKLFKALSNF